MSQTVFEDETNQMKRIRETISRNAEQREQAQKAERAQKAEARARIIEIWQLLEGYARSANAWHGLHGCLAATITTFCIKVLCITSQLDGVDVYSLPNPCHVCSQLEDQYAQVRRDYMVLKPTDVLGFSKYADMADSEIAELKKKHQADMQLKGEKEEPYTQLQFEGEKDEPDTQFEGGKDEPDTQFEDEQNTQFNEPIDTQLEESATASLPAPMPPAKRRKGEPEPEVPWDTE